MSDGTPPPPPPGGYGGAPPPPPGGYGGAPPPPPPGGYGGGAYGAGPYGAGAPGPKPDNNLVWAILSTVLCCLPLGIVSIVFASQVDSKWAAGDYAGARESADKAKKFAIFSVGAIVAVFVLVIVGGVILALLGNANRGY